MNLLLKYNQYLKQVFPTQALVSKIPDADKVKFTITKDKQIKQHYIGGEPPKTEDKHPGNLEPLELSESLEPSESLELLGGDADFKLEYIENNNVIIIGGMSPDYVSGMQSVPLLSKPLQSSQPPKPLKPSKSKSKTPKDDKPKDNKPKDDKPKNDKPKNDTPKSKTLKKKTIHVSCLNGDECKNKLIEELKSKYKNINIDEHTIDNNTAVDIIFTETYSFDDGNFTFNIPDADHLFYIPCTNYEHLISSFVHKDPELNKKLKIANYFDKADKKECKKHNKQKIEKYLTAKKNELNNYHSNSGYIELNPDYNEIHKILIKYN